MDIFDYHIHTKSSADSTAEPADMVRAAKAAGLSGICITNHADINPFLPPDHFPFDIDEVESDLDAAVAEGERIGMPVARGIEIGVMRETVGEYKKFMRGRRYDFIICSQHFIHGEDPYDGNYYDGKTRREAYEEYLRESIATVRAYQDYSVVGHIGYVAKYGPGEPPYILDMAEYKDYLDELLRAVIDAGRGIEANTSAIARTGEPMAAYSVIKRYIELGGEIVTTGSDSHEPSRVGENIRAVTERLAALGVKYICTFKDMEPHFSKL